MEKNAMDRLMDNALRYPLAASDPALGYYALSQGVAKLVKRFIGR